MLFVAKERRTLAMKWRKELLLPKRTQSLSSKPGWASLFKRVAYKNASIIVIVCITDFWKSCERSAQSHCPLAYPLRQDDQVVYCFLNYLFHQRIKLFIFLYPRNQWVIVGRKVHTYFPDEVALIDHYPGFYHCQFFCIRVVPLLKLGHHSTPLIRPAVINADLEEDSEERLQVVHESVLFAIERHETFKNLLCIQ